MSVDLKSIEQFCCKIAVQAGHKIMDIYQEEATFANVQYKSDHSPLTLADIAANQLIVTALQEKYPEYAVLSEEGKDDLSRLQNQYCFIVDPLDGTKEFVKRNGQFTVNIALAYRHKVVMGVIYVPVSQELYFACQGNGAFYMGANDLTTRIHVSKQKDLSKVRLVMSSSHGCEAMERLIEQYHFTNFIKMGSSLKGCLIAKGEAELYYRHNPTMEWDTAAMQCIAEEAGAIFRQMDGTEMLYNRENSLNDKGFYIINCPENELQGV